MSDWIVRPYQTEDEDCVVAMWLKGYSRTTAVQDAGFAHANEDGHPDHVRYWRVHQPVVVGLVSATTITVACDPQRSSYDDGKRAVIWAWAACSGDEVHWVGIKHSVIQAGLGPDLLRAVLGDRMDREQRYTSPLRDLRRIQEYPAQWKRGADRMSMLRAFSERMLRRDAVFATAAAHVLDQRRAEWRTSTERAA